MSIRRTGQCGVYAADISGNLTHDDDQQRFLAWHIGPGGSATITIHGNLDCYVNGQLVKGNGSVIYRVQPDDTYVGVEKLRPMRQSMECHGLLTPAPALLSGSLGLTVANNAGGKGNVKVAVVGQRDDWDGPVPMAGNKIQHPRQTPDFLLAQKYDRGAKKEYAIELSEAAGAIKCFKFPSVEADACNQWSSFYPASGDLYDLAFRIAGLVPGDCTPTYGSIHLTQADVVDAQQFTSLQGGKLTFDASSPAADQSLAYWVGHKTDSGAPSGASIAVGGSESVPDALGGPTSNGTFVRANVYAAPPGLVNGMTEFDLTFTLLAIPVPSGAQEVQCFAYVANPSFQDNYGNVSWFPTFGMGIYAWGDIGPNWVIYGSQVGGLLVDTGIAYTSNNLKVRYTQIGNVQSIYLNGSNTAAHTITTHTPQGPLPISSPLIYLQPDVARASPSSGPRFEMRLDSHIDLLVVTGT